jgi:ABC-type dipeptide/oligopeptide/nickel transport system permease component
MTRLAMIEALARTTSRPPGPRACPSERSRQHALRNADPGRHGDLAAGRVLLVGSVLVETTLGLGGLGSLITDSIQNRDYSGDPGPVLLLSVAFSLLEPAHGPSTR